MIEIEENELRSVVHRGMADLLDQVAEHFESNKSYKGHDVIVWLGSFANIHRRQALEALNG